MTPPRLPEDDAYTLPRLFVDGALAAQGEVALSSDQTHHPCTAASHAGTGAEGLQRARRGDGRVRWNGPPNARPPRESEPYPPPAARTGTRPSVFRPPSEAPDGFSGGKIRGTGRRTRSIP